METHIMNYNEAKALKQQMYDECDIASAKLAQFPKGPMGLTPDDVKKSDEFKTAKREFDVSFEKMRNINAWFIKNFKKEYNAERKNRFNN